MNILFEKLTQFLGRNGMCKCSGVNLFRSDIKNEDPYVTIAPINSKNLTGKCMIQIPVDKINDVISALQECANKKTGKKFKGKTKGEKFYNAIKEVIEERGAIAQDTLSSSSEWVIETKYGKLSISLYEPEKRQKLFTVFTRFEEPKRAKEHTDCNTCSGKWNFHMSNMEETIKFFTLSLDKILPEKKDETKTAN